MWRDPRGRSRARRTTEDMRELERRTRGTDGAATAVPVLVIRGCRPGGSPSGHDVGRDVHHNVDGSEEQDDELDRGNVFVGAAFEPRANAGVREHVLDETIPPARSREVGPILDRGGRRVGGHDGAASDARHALQPRHLDVIAPRASTVGARIIRNMYGTTTITRVRTGSTGIYGCPTVLPGGIGDTAGNKLNTFVATRTRTRWLPRTPAARSPRAP